MAPDRLVSCLCPTHGRPALLRRAVACFLAQTYAPRELVVVHQAHDAATRDYLATLAEPMVRPVEIAPSPQLGPGSLRNAALRAARGHYVAVWDDDDWYGPTRLAEQLGVIASTGKPACVLTRIILYDGATRSAFLSGPRTWENSLVAERAAVPEYSNRRRGSDTRVINRILAEKRLAGLDHADLYVYVYHGANVRDREHWDSKLLAQAQALTAEQSRQVSALLGLGER